MFHFFRLRGASVVRSVFNSDVCVVFVVIVFIISVIGGVTGAKNSGRSTTRPRSNSIIITSRSRKVSFRRGGTLFRRICSGDLQRELYRRCPRLILRCSRFITSVGHTRVRHTRRRHVRHVRQRRRHHETRRGEGTRGHGSGVSSTIHTSSASFISSAPFVSFTSPSRIHQTIVTTRIFGPGCRY